MLIYWSACCLALTHLFAVVEIELCQYHVHCMAPHKTIFVRPQVVPAVLNLNEQWTEKYSESRDVENNSSGCQGVM